MREAPPPPTPGASRPRRLRRGTWLALGLVVLTGCGSRVVDNRQAVAPSAAPEPTPVAASAPPSIRVGSSELPLLPPSSGDAAPSTTIRRSTTTTTDPTYPAFCAALAKVPLDDVYGFVVFEQDRIDAIGAGYAEVQRLAPDYLQSAAGDLQRPVAELVAKVDGGEIVDATSLQLWLQNSDQQVLGNWVVAQRQMIAFREANCV